MREAGEGLGDQRRHVRVHRPSQVLVAGGAELAAGHEHDVGEFRQRVDLLAVEQVGLDALDAATGKLLPQAFLAEAGNAHDPLAGRGALGELRQRRTDLSAHAKNEDVALKVFERGDEGRGRRGHHLLEVIHVAEAIRQRRGLAHPRSCPGTGIGVVAGR